MAVIKKDKDLIKFLVESGADPDLPNSKGFTARKFANRNPSLKKALEDALQGSTLQRSVLGTWEQCYRNQGFVQHWHLLPNSSLILETWNIKLPSGAKDCEGRTLGEQKFYTGFGSYSVSAPPPGARVKDKDAFYLDFKLEKSPVGPVQYFNLVKGSEESLIFSLDQRGAFPTNKDFRLKQFLNKAVLKKVK